MFYPSFKTLYVDENLSFPLWRGIKGEENAKFDFLRMYPIGLIAK